MCDRDGRQTARVSETLCARHNMTTRSMNATQDKDERCGAEAALPQIPAEFLEQLIPGPVTPAQFEDIFQRFKKAFMERALGAEMSQHLGYKAGQEIGRASCRERV